MKTRCPRPLDDGDTYNREAAHSMDVRPVRQPTLGILIAKYCIGSFEGLNDCIIVFDCDHRRQADCLSIFINADGVGIVVEHLSCFVTIGFILYLRHFWQFWGVADSFKRFQNVKNIEADHIDDTSDVIEKKKCADQPAKAIL